MEFHDAEIAVVVKKLQLLVDAVGADDHVYRGPHRDARRRKAR